MSDPRRSGVLVEISACVPGGFEEFDAFAARREARRAALTGVTGVRRYRDVADDGGWLTVYETVDPHVLPEDMATLPADEIAVEASLPRLERRTYAEVDVPDQHRRDLPPHAGCLLAVWWTPAGSAVADFHAWYDEEHIPLLLQVPGWRAIRRYRLVRGAGPQFLALHYLDSSAVLSTPEHKRVVATPWRARVAASREQHERRVFMAWTG